MRYKIDEPQPQLLSYVSQYQCIQLANEPYTSVRMYMYLYVHANTKRAKKHQVIKLQW